LKPGGTLLGSNHNHSLTLEEIEAIKKFGLSFEQDRYEDGEKVNFYMKNVEDPNDQGIWLFDYWYTNETT
jgi:hypothetical protein